MLKIKCFNYYKISYIVRECKYYNLHPTQALRGLTQVKTERITGR